MVAIIGEAEQSFATLTHYTPVKDDVVLNLEKLRELAGEIGGKKRIETAQVEIFVRGRLTIRGEERLIVPKNLDEVDILANGVREQFGEKTTIKVTPYDYFGLLASGSGGGEVRVTIKPEEKKKIVGIFEP